MDTQSTLTFPVIRGLQANREYFVAMWSLRMMRQISIFNEDELPAEMRAQRTLNKARIPEIAGYIINNPDDYVFSALTVSIDSDVAFEPVPGQDKLGVLRVPMDAKFIINDGQHRRAAINAALEQRPELGHETISVVFFIDIGLERCQQMFADLNRHAIRPSRSIGLLYDHRNDKSKLAKLVILKSPFFKEIVDMEKSSLAPRSRKLFTLSAFYNACADLVEGIATGNLEHDAEQARTFWEEVASHFPIWAQVREGRIPASEVREGFIHSHGITLQALGNVGNALIKLHPKDWKKRLRGLENIDWAKTNASTWEGRALIGGKVSKVTTNIILTTNEIKKKLSIPLDESEEKVENAFSRRNTSI